MKNDTNQPNNDLAQAIKRIGGSAEQAGVSLDELTKLVNTVHEITGRGGVIIGNSLKTIFTRLTRDEVKVKLEEIGIDTSSKNALIIMKNLANKHPSLDHKKQMEIAELIGGVFQINVFRAILESLEGEL